MNLIFNAEALRPPITGVGNYTFHLLEQFLDGTLVDEVHCFSGTHWLSGDVQLAVAAALKAQSSNNSSNDKQSIVDVAISRARKAIGRIPGTPALYTAIMERRFERKAIKIPSAVYHETNYVMKPYPGACVTTVHDLSYIRYAQYHPDRVVEWLKRYLPESLDRADRIITVSNLVREELIDHFNIPDEKICVIYEGSDSCYRPRTAEETSSVLSSFGLLHKQYVLLVATLDPRKGIDVLLDAWCMLPELLRLEFPLVLAGSPGWHNRQLLDRIEALVTEGTVRHLGFVPTEVLPALYSGAAVFSYPSVYEGFGLPVLDAMSSAVPVICRARTSMAEFSQGACVLCDTGEAEELAVKLEMLLQSQAARDDWAQKGLKQAAQYSWKRCAEETAEIYRHVSRI